MVCPIDDEIHARKSDYFMELTAPFVDVSPFGHEGANLASLLLDELWNPSSEQRHLCFVDVGKNLLGDKKDFLRLHESAECCNFNAKIYKKSRRNAIQK